jgi:phosphoesterase RecJ-like protein
MIYFDADASSTAELLFGLLEEAKMPIDEYVGEAIFTGILTDTGSFRFPNVTVNTMEVVTKLIKTGISTSKVSSMIYERMTLANRKLLGRTMERLSTVFDGKLALTAITWNDMTEFSAEMKDADFIVDEIRKLKGAEIYVFAKEYRPDQFRISMRARGSIDLSILAQKYGGGGHHDAAGFNTTGDWLFVRANLLQIFEAVFKGQ